MSSSLMLEPEPQSVRRARLWVVEELQELGRPDLADSAELGVSELVTNAILHADPPITVRIGGTPQHPRVEVHDNSKLPPAVNVDMQDEDALLRTVGRGLGIVALYSSTWGADVSPDGKVVWFEPSLEPDPLADIEGDVFDLVEAVEERLHTVDAPDVLLPVRLLGLPVRLFASFRVWYAEIRRELRILALSHGGEYPVASEMAEIIVQVEQERHQARGVEQLDEAIEAGLERVDLEYQVLPTTPATMQRLSDLLDRVDDFSREHRLLTMAATPQIAELRRWYFGEFVRQPAGKDPAPWPGSYAVDPREK